MFSLEIFFNMASIGSSQYSNNQTVLKMMPAILFWIDFVKLFVIGFVKLFVIGCCWFELEFAGNSDCDMKIGNI